MWFFMLPEPETSLGRFYFESLEDIQSNVVKVLKAILENDLAVIVGEAENVYIRPEVT
jgi:hypothetical protein